MVCLTCLQWQLKVEFCHHVPVLKHLSQHTPQKLPCARVPQSKLLPDKQTARASGVAAKVCWGCAFQRGWALPVCDLSVSYRVFAPFLERCTATGSCCSFPTSLDSLPPLMRANSCEECAQFVISGSLSSHWVPCPNKVIQTNTLAGKDSSPNGA